MSKDNIEDLKKARQIFIEQLSDWKRQEPFYEKKIESIQAQDDSQKYTWSIFLKGTNTVIGQITCQPKDNEPENIRDVGWFIDPNCQGKGYATEAALAIVQWVKEQLPYTELFACCDARNPASARVMERIGMHCIDANGSRTI